MPNCVICDSNEYKLKLTVDDFKIVECKYCGLIYLLNPFTIDNDSKTYDEYFEHSTVVPYHKKSPHESIKILWQINEQRLKWIHAITPAGSILDIGSGRGFFLSHAATFGYHPVEGIEISAIAAQYSEQHYKIKTRVCSIERSMDFSTQYDIITLWHVLEHFSNPLSVLKNVKRILNKNGLLWIEVPNYHNLKFLLSPASKKWIGGNHPKHHRFFFTAQSLSRLLSNAGFNNSVFITNSYAIKEYYLIKNLTKFMLKKMNMDSFLTVYASL